MSQTILVTLDGSPLSELALERAADLAAGRDAELVLFSVVDAHLRNELEEFSASEQVDVVEAARGYLEERAEPLRLRGVKVRTEAVAGQHPAEEIVGFAETYGISMIVMCTHGRSGLTRWLLGSVADKVVRSATVPVLVVPARREERSR